MYHATRQRYRRLSENAAATATLAMDTMGVAGVKARNIRYDRYNPWARLLKRHTATRMWRYRTARILTQKMHDLPTWVKDNVDWESVSLIHGG